MQGVNVFENGIGYLFKCLNLYTSGTGFFVLYLAAVMFIVIKGDRREREIFVPGAVVLALTVYNPVVPLILDKIFDVSSEYYRLFWIAPVGVAVSYIAVKLIDGAKKGRERAAVAAIIACMFIFGGNFVYAKGIDIAQNIYKMPDELIEISRIVHEDSGTEYTRAFFEYDYNMEIRQYDPKMLLCVNREEYLYAVNYSYTEEMLADETKPVYKILARLVRNQKIDEDDFTQALDDTQTLYVILTKGHPQEEFVKKAGLYEVGATPAHRVYRYDPADPPEYGLIDYTDVEHRFSYRRLK